jgi:hypothetical protein
MRKMLLASILMCISSQLFAYCEGGYPNISLANEIAKADFIIIGKVTSRRIVVDPKEDPQGYEAELFQIKVNSILNGNPKQNIIKPYLTVYNNNDSSRFVMDVGETYLLFVYDGMDGRWVNSCGNSDTYKESAEKINTIKKLVGAKHT